MQILSSKRLHNAFLNVIDVYLLKLNFQHHFEECLRDHEDREYKTKCLSALVNAAIVVLGYTKEKTVRLQTYAYLTELL